MSNVTLDTLTRAEAHRKLLALGMSADVAADYLDSEASLTARLALSLACPGACPILEAYQRHCKSKATDPLDTVPEEERERIRKIANESGPSVTDYYDVIAREVAAYHARTDVPRLTPAEEAEIIASAPAHIGPWTPESWNMCPKCKGPVEKADGDVDFADGDEAKCTDCGAVLMVSIAEDGGPCSVYEPEANVVAQDERSEVCRRMQAALFHIRTAQQMALESVPGGEVRLAIVAKDATGAGSLAADFDAKPFLADVITLFRAFRATGPTVDSGQDIEARAEGACRAFEDAIEPEDMPAHLMLRAAWREVVRYCDSSARLESAESLFAKWTPLLSPYLNEGQLADLRRDIMRAEVAILPGVDPSALSSDDASLVARAPTINRRAWLALHTFETTDSWLAVVRAVDASRPVPVAAAADRLASGHVQRLRDGTWEWCHDGGFDNGVVTFSPATNAWLSEVVKDAGHSGLTEEQLDVLARAMPDVVDYERATPEQRRRTVLDVLAAHGPRPPIERDVERIGLDATMRALPNQPGLTGDAWTSLVRAIATLAENDSLVDDAITATERAGCPADVVLHLREINDAMYRRRMRGQSGQSGITWSTAIKVAIALAPHGDVTAQAQTVMRIAGKHQGITEEAIDALHALAGAICATQGRDPEQKAQLQRVAEAHDALRYALGDKDPDAADAILPVRFPGHVLIPRAVLESLVDATEHAHGVRKARETAERILQQATLAAEPARADPEVARRLAERHFLIIGPALGEVIGCTSSQGMPSPREVGEPGATFREVSVEACPLCAVVGGAK